MVKSLNRYTDLIHVWVAQAAGLLATAASRRALFFPIFGLVGKSGSPIDQNPLFRVFLVRQSNGLVPRRAS